MGPRFLNVHGVVVSVEGCDEAVSALLVHFAAFVVGSAPGRPDVSVALRRAEPRLELGARLAADQYVQRGVVYNLGPLSVVDHHGHAISRFDHEQESGVVTAPAVEDLVELGYLMVHSRVGILLERRGLVRVHALGFVRDGFATLVLAPPGGGKSTLALALLRHTDAQLLSDDLVLVDRSGRAHAFPHPIGIRDPDTAADLGSIHAFPRRHHGPKWVVGLDGLLGRHAREPAPIGAIAQLVRVTSPPSRVVRTSVSSMGWALWKDAVIGAGLPQVVELLVPRGSRDLWRQAPSALRRSAAAVRLMLSAKSLRLEVHGPEEAALAIFEASPGRRVTGG